MKTTNHPMTKEISEQMLSKVSSEKATNRVLIVSKDCDDLKEEVKSKFAFIRCVESINNERLLKYDLVLANPTLSEDGYSEFIQELFRLTADSGQLITTCLNLWIDSLEEQDELFKHFVEANGYYEDIKDDADLILLILSK